MIQVIIADDQPLALEGMASVLGASFEVVGKATNGDAAAALASSRETAPVLFSDLNMPGIESVLALANSLPVVICSFSREPEIVRRALKSGARAYITKDAPLEDVIHSVRSAAEGGAFVSAGIDMNEVLNSPKRNTGLSSREDEVVGLIASGLCTKEIASELGLTPQTIKSYRKQAMKKIGAQNAAQVVNWWREYGSRNQPAEAELLAT